MTYLDRLQARVEAVGTHLCLGIDPDPASLPAGFSPDADGIESFSRLLLRAAMPRAAAVKVNIAFFEAFGSAGIAALERLRSEIPPDVPFIVDAKRGDIGSTAVRQAAALFDGLGADAITVSPFLGLDAVEPFMQRTDRFVYVLCRTSNARAAAIQGVSVDGVPLFIHVARMVSSWAAETGNLGLVVGATAPAELAAVRGIAPELPFLVPGIGAQGGDVDAVLREGPATESPGSGVRGGALLINISRGIASAALDGADAEFEIATASERWALTLQC